MGGAPDPNDIKMDDASWVEEIMEPHNAYIAAPVKQDPGGANQPVSEQERIYGVGDDVGE